MNPQIKPSVRLHTTMPAYTRNPLSKDMLKWSAPFDVPQVGQDILIRINAIGRAKVVGYGAQDGYLGVMTVPYDPPGWWIRQNGSPGADNAALAFGAEISLIPAGEGA